MGPLPFEGRDDDELGARLASDEVPLRLRLLRPHNTVVRGGYGICFSAWRGAVAGTSDVGQQGFDQLSYLVTSFGGDGLSRRTPDGPSTRTEPVLGFRELPNLWKCPILTSGNMVNRCTLFILRTQ
jgi:hypothetical protein